MPWENSVFGKDEVIIAKQCHGLMGNVYLTLQAYFTCFNNLTNSDNLPENSLKSLSYEWFLFFLS